MNILYKSLTITIFFIGAIGLASFSHAEEYSLSYGARLTEANGAPILGQGGKLDLEVSFYNAAAGGSPIGPSPISFPGTGIAEGVFHLSITLTPPEFHQVFQDPSTPVYIEVKDVKSGATFPRQRFSVIPFALKTPIDDDTIVYDSDGKLTVGSSVGTVKQVTAGSGLTGGTITDSGTIAVDTGTTGNKIVQLSDGKLPSVDGSNLSSVNAEKLQTRNISAAVPVSGQVLKWSGSAWVPSSDLVGETGSGEANTASNVTSGSGVGLFKGKVSADLRFYSLSPGAGVTINLVDDDVVIASTITQYTNAMAKAAAVADSITDSVTNIAPSQNAVFDALSGKQASIMTSTDLGLNSINTNAVNAITVNPGVSTGEIKFKELSVNGANYVGLKAPGSITADLTFTLPGSAGTNGQFLKTDGSGNLSWTDQASAPVTSVNTLTGAVNLLTTNIAEGTNLYYSDARAKTAAVGDAITDAVTDKAPSQNAVFDALALKSEASHSHIGVYEPAGLSADVVTTTKILNGAVTTDKITDANVTSAKIASGVDAAKIGGGSVDNTEFGYLNGVTSAIQTQFTGKQASITSTSDIVAGSLTSAKQNAISVAPFNTAAGNTGELRFNELAANGTNFVGLKAPDLLAADKIWTLPAADGTSGQVLKTNGSGVLSWIDQTAAAPVSSVNTLTGAVTLTTTNISEGTNLYYTDARAKAAAVGDAITDAVTDKAPSQNAVFDALALKSATSHNHSGVYEPAGLSTDVVTTTKILNGAVTSAKIASLGVDSANINTGAVTAAKIAACSDTQILKMSGVNWVCSSDANSGGTVTSVASGTGLTGGPITGTGTLSLATSGVAAGTYTKVTVDTYGRATSGTTLGASDMPSSIDAAKIGSGTIDNTEFGYLNGVTSAVQTQLDGKVVGPASATDNAIARFDGATGKLVQNSSVVIDDSGNVGIGTTSPQTSLNVAGTIKVGSWDYIKTMVIDVPGDGTDSYTPVVFHRQGSLPTDPYGSNMRGVLSCGAPGSLSSAGYPGPGTYYGSSFELTMNLQLWNGIPPVAIFNHYSDYGHRGLGNAFFSGTHSIFILWFYPGTYVCNWNGQFEIAHTTSTSGILYSNAGTTQTASMLSYASRNKVFDTSLVECSWYSNNFYVNGSVGVGTTSPTSVLNIKGNSAVPSAPLALFESTSGGVQVGFKGYTSGYEWFLANGWNTNNDFEIFNYSSPAGVRKDVMFLQAASGNIGIGTSSPIGKLEVNGGDIVIHGGTGGNSNKVIFKTSDNGDLAKFIGTESYWTVIGANGNEGWKFKDDNGDVVMQINGLGGNNGNVGIGTTSPGYKLTVNGQPAANGYTAFTNYSDRRLKRNIRLLDDGILEKIMQLKPSSFYYNELTGYDEKTRKRKIFGFIAQELMEVFPEMVSKTNIDGKSFYDTNLSSLNVYLVKAMQEQERKVELLRDQNQKHENQLKEKDREISELRTDIELLTAFICAEKPDADFCKR